MNKLWVHLDNGMFLTTEMKCALKQWEDTEKPSTSIINWTQTAWTASDYETPILWRSGKAKAV